VAASAGRDLLDEPAFFVNCIERDLKAFGPSGNDVVDVIKSEAIFPADMLSRATSVTAAALGPRGQDVVDQACNPFGISGVW
jgi:hypothetical protein